MITEQQFIHTIRRSRQLSDANQNNTRDQWALFASFWQDSATLRRMADELGAGYQKLAKWSRAGAVIEAGVFDRDCDKSQEFLVQLSYFDPAEWDTVAEVGILGDLGPTELRTLRKLKEKLVDTQTHWCPCCDHKGGEWVAVEGAVEYTTDEPADTEAA